MNLNPLDLLKFGRGFRQEQAAQKRSDLKAHILTAMRQADRRNPAPLVFHVEDVTRLVNALPSTVVPALDELEREGRISYSNVLGGYSVRRLPSALM